MEKNCTVRKTETYTEYDFGNAIVRIHPGKLTEEELRVVLENAAKKFYKEILKQQMEKKKQESAQA